MAKATAITLLWKLIETTFEGVTKRTWRRDTKEARYVLSGDTDKDDVADIAAEADAQGQWQQVVIDDEPVVTKDGRPVFSLPFGKVLERVETEVSGTIKYTENIADSYTSAPMEAI